MSSLGALRRSIKKERMPLNAAIANAKRKAFVVPLARIPLAHQLQRIENRAVQEVASAERDDELRRRIIDEKRNQRIAELEKQVAEAAAANQALTLRLAKRPAKIEVHDLTSDAEEDTPAPKVALVIPPAVKDEVCKPGESECQVCLNHKAIILAAPCGHSSLCYKCASDVATSSKLCPFCRATITALYHIKMV